jgi:hypothetical protein
MRAIDDASARADAGAVSSAPRPGSPRVPEGPTPRSDTRERGTAAARRAARAPTHDRTRDPIGGGLRLVSLVLLLLVGAATALQMFAGVGALLVGLWKVWQTREFDLVLYGLGLAGAASLSSRWTLGLSRVLLEHTGEGVWGIVRGVVALPVLLAAAWVHAQGATHEDDEPDDEPSPWWPALAQLVLVGWSLAVVERFVAVPVALGLTLAALHAVGATLRARMP